MELLRSFLNPMQLLALNRNKMALLSGPRQCGKTTLAKQLTKFYDEFNYCNWDEAEFRRLWTKSPLMIIEKFNIDRIDTKKLLILDEIHKAKNWKQKLKGLYDHHSQDIHIIVTGSARLNTYRRSGESMMGRYYNFRLHPFTLGELTHKQITSPKFFLNLLSEKPQSATATFSLYQDLKILSGFPEPFLSGNRKIHRLWKKAHIDNIVREDLRDLSHITELSQVEMLISLLTDKIGSPLSIQSLREDLEVSYDTVKRWLIYLRELYHHFELKPWSRSIPRTLKKEGKIYFYDWTECSTTGAQFENLVACHLKKACDYWTDTGEGAFELFYLRNKEKQEIDFLLVKDKKPWLSVEAKSKASQLDESFKHFQKHTKCPHVQIVDGKDLYRKYTNFCCPTYLISAEHLLKHLP